MSTSEPQNIVVDEQSEGISHSPGTQVKAISVNHPTSGEHHTIYIPADHDGSRIRVEFPDGEYGWSEGVDPAEVATTEGEVVSEVTQMTSTDSGQSQQGAG